VDIGGDDAAQRSAYVRFMAPRLIRRSLPNREILTLLTSEGSVTIEISVRQLELSASELEKMLHAPLGVIARMGEES
jgi:hypothetical protein